MVTFMENVLGIVYGLPLPTFKVTEVNFCEFHHMNGMTAITQGDQLGSPNLVCRHVSWNCHHVVVVCPFARRSVQPILVILVHLFLDLLQSSCLYDEIHKLDRQITGYYAGNTQRGHNGNTCTSLYYSVLV